MFFDFLIRAVLKSWKLLNISGHILTYLAKKFILDCQVLIINPKQNLISYQVLTMLMGEYEYVANFVNDPSPSWVNKAIFVMFLIEMTVVLMNLVLGLAVADIDELQKNSAVQRMIQETYTVIFIDKIVSIFQKIPGVNM